jgi:DNA-binding CsgD family transcriptional regulator
VGRRRELDLLEELWPEVERGSRQVLFIGGDPGSGKSRLAAEAAMALHRHDVSVLVGTCSSDVGLPFDPLVEPVRALLPALDRGELVLGPSGAPDAEAARDLLRLLTEGSTQGSGPAIGAVAPVVFDVVVSVLESATRVRPVVLVLEDLQWAGESALRVLRYVVERTAGLPLLVLATHRTAVPEPSILLSRVLSDLFRLDGVRRVDLAGLDADEIADYLVLAGADTPHELRPAAALLRVRTGGNPFMLREVWRDLQRGGGLAALSEGEVRVPESLRAVLAGRLATLTPRQRELLLVAAVIGDEFEVDLVRAVHESGSPVAETFSDIEASVAAGLVEDVSGRPGRWRWPHALARQAVLDSHQLFELASAHAKVGFALEDGFQTEPSRLQRLAHHFTSAGGLGLREKAAHYLELVADTARRRLANSDAATLYERAAEQTPVQTERDRLLIAAAREHNLAGHMARSRAIAETVAASGHPEHRLAAAIEFEAAAWRTGLPGGPAVELLESALGVANDESDREVISARASLARALAFAGRTDEARAEGRRAVVLARLSGDEEVLAMALEVTLGDSLGLSDLTDRVARAEELTALAVRRGELHRLGPAAMYRNFGAYALGDVEGLESAHADMGRAVRATQQSFWRWTALLWQTTMHVIRCRFDEAAQSLAESHGLDGRFERADGASDGPWSLQSFALRRETGRLEFARSMVDQIASVPNPWRPGVVAICTELGIREPARAALHEALDHDRDRFVRSASWPAALGLLVDGAVWLGDTDAMQALLPEAQRYAGLNLAGSEFLLALGSADRVIGKLLSGLGLPGADECFTTALAMDRRMRAPLHEATTLAEHAAHLRRGGADGDRVEAVAGPARVLADRFDLHRVRRILGPDATRSGRSLPDGLTIRELDVLRLVGRGHSNRGIAKELFISEYTAANHVRSILMKTRCANRTAAAHYAVQHGLLGDGPDGDSSDHGVQ